MGAEISGVSFYVRLNLDGLHLFVQQHDIFSVEISDDVQLFSAGEAAKQEHRGALGWITVSERSFRVYALSGKMAKLRHIPENARYCVIFQTEKAAYALVCEDMENLHRDYQPTLQKVPVCMHSSYTPFVYLTVYAEQLGCVTTCEGLYKYLTGGGEALDAPVREQLALA